ncbi:6-bladed beta-propeller [Aliifodinibius salicampi]|uniref:6-bladed beta-propeller n=1 Tax=Fodinibius salicampi TaxID=1920655 RepID=A0ABT3PWL4_9BACT|nr:6-bladed beta-propeller [Fodinibius salicampi]MCW9712232.1 6-bladed beta-propeller [Fodinibius salicampi]
MYSNIRQEIFFVLVYMVISIIGCQSESASDSTSSGGEVVELKDYKTVVSYKDGILANPAAMKYDGDSLLYIYDFEHKQVLALNKNGETTREFGGEGRGPGEVIWFNNIYLNDDYFYIVDPVQFRIIKYSLDGEVEGSLDYGQKGSQSMPPPPPQSLISRAKNITNEPFVTASGDVLLPAIRQKEEVSSLYTLVDWEGKELTKIGDIPEGSVFVLDGEQYRDAINEREVPGYYKPRVFPVNDQANNDELYFIYTAFPKIVKYNTSGKKLWEQAVPETIELDSVYTLFYEKSEGLREGGTVALNTYMSGVSSENGLLYLVLGKYGFEEASNDLWIHEFTNNGELRRRFRLILEDVNLAAIFDIDFANQQMFTVTEEAEIRAYGFGE